LPSVFGSTVFRIGSYSATIIDCAASKPPSRNTAPTIASTVSPRIDGRRKPPLLASPSPSSR